MSGYIFRTAGNGEAHRLHPLWKQGFGDTDSFIACYDAQMFQPENVELALWEDTPVSMMTLIPGQLHTAEGRVFPVGCVYGLATAPEHRGHGVAARLLQSALGRDRQAGLAIVPAEESLFGYYARTVSAYPAFFARTLSLDRSEISAFPPLWPVSAGAETYRAVRENALSGKTHMSWDIRAVDFQKAVCRDCGGDLFRFDAPEPCCAVAEYAEDGSLIVSELLAPEGLLGPCLAGLLESLPAGRGTVRLPVWSAALGGEPQPHGMLVNVWSEDQGLEFDSGAYFGFDFC